MTKVSVVIPLYNKEHHISRALDSVLAQTLPPDEIIVVNDGSTDNGARVVTKYHDPRIRLIHQQNAGVSAARNRGISEATGELISFLDAGDAYKPTFLQTISNLRQSNPHCGAYATAYEIEDIAGIITPVAYDGIPTTDWEGIVPSYFRSVAGGEPLICSSAVAIPKHIFAECGGFPIGEHLGEDLDCWLRIALRYPIAFSTRVGATYYRTAENRTAGVVLAYDGYRLVDTALTAIACHQVTDDDARYLTQYAERFLLIAAWHAIVSGQPGKAWRHLCRCQVHGYWRNKLKILIWCTVPPGITLRVKAFVQNMRKMRISP